MSDYDSTLDTLRHSRRVDELLLEVIASLQARVTRHDRSKMQDPEKEMFDSGHVAAQDIDLRLRRVQGPPRRHGRRAGPPLRQQPTLPGALRRWRQRYDLGRPRRDAGRLEGSYRTPVDWKAATERHDDGNLARSLPIQAERFQIAEQILTNTATEFGWLL